MSPGYVDLHCHSTASDGTLSPTDVVRLARDRGLVGLALTDHDTIGGVAEAEAEAGKDKDPASVVGRPHIAAILNRKGYVSSIKQAFDKYLAPGGLAYFDKERLTPRRALEMIHPSGGLPRPAHPVQLRTENDAQLERAVKDLVDLGLVGIEVMHSDHDAALIEKYSRLAGRF